MAKGEPSSEIRKRVIEASNIQRERFEKELRIHSNAGMGSKEIQKYCHVQPEAQDMLKMAITELNFSARGYDRILKVSRTIADLEGSQTIEQNHVNEAIQYRTLDRQMWI